MVGQIRTGTNLKRTEVFRDGEWSIYTIEFPKGSPGAGYDSYIFHYREWKETVKQFFHPVRKSWVNWKGWVDTLAPGTKVTSREEQMLMRCKHTFFPTKQERCTHCNKRVPEHVIAIWKLHNMDKQG